MIRDITSADVAWGMALAQRRYPDFHEGGALIALGQAITLETALAIREDNAFLVGNIVAPGWFPKRPEFHVLWLCTEEGHHWEAIRLLRHSIRWAEVKGCRRWWFASETDHGVGSLAVRVGAMPYPRYVFSFVGNR